MPLQSLWTGSDPGSSGSDVVPESHKRPHGHVSSPSIKGGLTGASFTTVGWRGRSRRPQQNKDTLESRVFTLDTHFTPEKRKRSNYAENCPLGVQFDLVGDLNHTTKRSC